MTVQPQLVLLQKTLLYIEGLGRQLYPQLDLWQTAKPFLENWMKEQIGLTAMLKKIQANLPFWSEKLPDMPDLVHDSLKQLRTLPEVQQRHFEQQMALQRRQHKAQLATIVGGTLFILAALMPVAEIPWWSSALLIAAASPCWVYAIRRSGAAAE
jgi:ubiquinone biosynthesis protein